LGTNPYLTIYNHLLFNFEGDYTQEQIGCYYKLKNKLTVLEYIKGYKLPNGMTDHQCMADSSHSLVITPSGIIGKCEHFTEEKMIGSIFTEDIDSSVLKMWNERYDKQKECNLCPLYPTCIRIKMCPNQKKHCSDFYRKDRMESLNIAIKYCYKEWKIHKAELTGLEN
jgi:radical SAM protein with 4Fe4S-binding SPASM domain